MDSVDLLLQKYGLPIDAKPKPAPGKSTLLPTGPPTKGAAATDVVLEDGYPPVFAEAARKMYAMGTERDLYSKMLTAQTRANLDSMLNFADYTRRNERLLEDNKSWFEPDVRARWMLGHAIELDRGRVERMGSITDRSKREYTLITPWMAPSLATGYRLESRIPVVVTGELTRWKLAVAFGADELFGSADQKMTGRIVARDSQAAVGGRRRADPSTTVLLPAQVDLFLDELRVGAVKATPGMSEPEMRQLSVLALGKVVAYMSVLRIARAGVLSVASLSSGDLRIKARNGYTSMAKEMNKAMQERLLLIPEGDDLEIPEEDKLVLPRLKPIGLQTVAPRILAQIGLGNLNSDDRANALTVVERIRLGGAVLSQAMARAGNERDKWRAKLAKAYAPYPAGNFDDAEKLVEAATAEMNARIDASVDAERNVRINRSIGLLTVASRANRVLRQAPTPPAAPAWAGRAIVDNVDNIGRKAIRLLTIDVAEEYRATFEDSDNERLKPFADLIKDDVAEVKPDLRVQKVGATLRLLSDGLKTLFLPGLDGIMRRFANLLQTMLRDSATSGGPRSDALKHVQKWAQFMDSSDLAYMDNGTLKRPLVLGKVSVESQEARAIDKALTQLGVARSYTLIVQRRLLDLVREAQPGEGDGDVPMQGAGEVEADIQKMLFSRLVEVFRAAFPDWKKGEPASDLEKLTFKNERPSSSSALELEEAKLVDTLCSALIADINSGILSATQEEEVDAQSMFILEVAKLGDCKKSSNALVDFYESKGKKVAKIENEAERVNELRLLTAQRVTEWDGNKNLKERLVATITQMDILAGDDEDLSAFTDALKAINFRTSSESFTKITASTFELLRKDFANRATFALDEPDQIPVPGAEDAVSFNFDRWFRANRWLSIAAIASNREFDLISDAKGKEFSTKQIEFVEKRLAFEVSKDILLWLNEFDTPVSSKLKEGLTDRQQYVNALQLVVNGARKGSKFANSQVPVPDKDDLRLFMDEDDVLNVGVTADQFVGKVEEYENEQQTYFRDYRRVAYQPNIGIAFLEELAVEFDEPTRIVVRSDLLDLYLRLGVMNAQGEQLQLTPIVPAFPENVRFDAARNAVWNTVGMNEEEMGPLLENALRYLDFYFDRAKQNSSRTIENVFKIARQAEILIRGLLEKFFKKKLSKGKDRILPEINADEIRREAERIVRQGRGGAPPAPAPPQPIVQGKLRFELIAAQADQVLLGTTLESAITKFDTEIKTRDDKVSKIELNAIITTMTAALENQGLDDEDKKSDIYLRAVEFRDNVGRFLNRLYPEDELGKSFSVLTVQPTAPGAPSPAVTMARLATAQLAEANAQLGAQLDALKDKLASIKTETASPSIKKAAAAAVKLLAKAKAADESVKGIEVNIGSAKAFIEVAENQLDRLNITIDEKKVEAAQLFKDADDFLVDQKVDEIIEKTKAAQDKLDEKMGILKAARMKIQENLGIEEKVVNLDTMITALTERLAAADFSGLASKEDLNKLEEQTRKEYVSQDNFNIQVERIRKLELGLLPLQPDTGEGEQTERVTSPGGKRRTPTPKLPEIPQKKKREITIDIAKELNESLNRLSDSIGISIEEYKENAKDVNDLWKSNSDKDLFSNATLNELRTPGKNELPPNLEDATGSLRRFYGSIIRSVLKIAKHFEDEILRRINAIPIPTSLRTKMTEILDYSLPFNAFRLDPNSLPDDVYGKSISEFNDTIITHVNTIFESLSSAFELKEGDPSTDGKDQLDAAITDFQKVREQSEKDANAKPTSIQSVQELLELAASVGVDWPTASYSPEDLQQGIAKESETSPEPDTAARVAVRHLESDPNHYLPKEKGVDGIKMPQPRRVAYVL